ncbi:Fe-S cluster assembly protein SufD [Legionella bononiensis]|uniref:Fe-S cluster assembly protein SufD n=1 Tax=Legionella bononiensis TaxID=2793102 RepID=A0ABS1W6L8_9GAMM|nr:Fe-S cluster assembly protein SufD [Legionella bononiensis]MBL7478382.1 Fe-S cluster assembly protein SufD [Legionella bononiensis]MBL7524979.1 Fe-S cluster assembly protein SufD [Legionella bononiensis]MBL7561276.1 Fe-S cluster assembly protein SufD [Legionella bononiensis]
MNEILSFYQQQAKAGKSTIPWLAQMQDKALEQLSRHGFPTRHDEEWKYTLLDSFLKQPFETPQHASSSNSVTSSNLPVKQQVFIQDGVVVNEPEWIKQLPKGVLLMPLALALTTHEDLIKTYLGTILNQEHGFHSLNTALIHSGVFLYIPRGVCIEEPIALIHNQNQDNQAVHLRHLIIAEADSQATLLEEYKGAEACSYLTNTVTEVFVGAGARLSHYKIQNESKSAYHLGHTAVRQSAHSEFFNHSLSLGGKLVRSDISIYLQEEHAHCLMNGIYAPAEGQHVDHHTTVHHLVPECTSEQDYKGILTGRSRAVFNGKVIVSKDAQHTNAKQQNKNLLLSANAEIDTKPQLEIFADDVLCSHGATVGQLDEEALFYLATRGIGRLEASKYLIHAFAQDNLRLIQNRDLADWMGQLLTQQLGYANEY